MSPPATSILYGPGLAGRRSRRDQALAAIAVGNLQPAIDRISVAAPESEHLKMALRKRLADELCVAGGALSKVTMTLSALEIVPSRAERIVIASAGNDSSMHLLADPDDGPRELLVSAPRLLCASRPAVVVRAKRGAWRDQRASRCQDCEHLGQEISERLERRALHHVPGLELEQLIAETLEYRQRVDDFSPAALRGAVRARLFRTARVAAIALLRPDPVAAVHRAIGEQVMAEAFAQVSDETMRAEVDIEFWLFLLRRLFVLEDPDMNRAMSWSVSLPSEIIRSFLYSHLEDALKGWLPADC